MGWLDDLTEWVGDAVPWGEKSAGWRAQDNSKRVRAVREASRNRRFVDGWRAASDRDYLGSMVAKGALGLAALFGALSSWGLLGGGFSLSWWWSGAFLCAGVMSALYAASGRRRLAEIQRHPGGVLPELIHAFAWASIEFSDARDVVERSGRPKAELEGPVRMLAQLAETIEAYDLALHEDHLDQLSREHRELVDRVHSRIDDLSRGRRARRELEAI